MKDIKPLKLAMGNFVHYRCFFWDHDSDVMGRNWLQVSGWAHILTKLITYQGCAYNLTPGTNMAAKQKRTGETCMDRVVRRYM